MKIVAVSGTQGSGKSTLLDTLKSWGYKVDDFKVSRHIQEKLGAQALSELTTTFEGVKKFQNMILEAKMEREEQLSLGDGLILTERSFADICSYANIWVNKLIDQGKVSRDEGVEFTINFADICSDYQQIYAGVVMVPYMDHIKWQDDAKRAAWEDIATFNSEMNSFMTFLQPSNVPAFYVSEKSTTDRASQVEAFLKGL